MGTQVETDQEPRAHWYCLKGQPKREHIAASILRKELRLEVFCPRVSEYRKTRSGKKRFTEALFPGYLFARMDLQEHYRRIIHVKGVHYLVQQGDTPIPIEPPVIAQLREGFDDSEVLQLETPILDPGSEIEIISGSLQGMTGKVIAQLPAQNRIQILLNFLGRDLNVTVESDDILLKR